MENNLNTLFVIPNLNPGGSQKLIINLINNIKLKNKLLFVYKKKLFLKNHIDKKIELKFSNSSKIVLSLFELKSLLKKKQINIIFSCMRNMNIILGVFAFFFDKKVKLVFHEPNTLDEFKKPSIKKYLKLQLMRAAYSNIDYLIANSKDTKNDLIKYKIIDDKKIKIISNPISVDARKKIIFYK